MSSLFAVAYVVPLVSANHPLDILAFLIVGSTGVVVAETIARGQRRTLEARSDEHESAQAFRAVARASAALQQLEPGLVLDAVVDGVIALGYDGANLVVIDDADSFVLIHPRGLSLELGTDRHPLGGGMTSIISKTRRSLVIEDYASWEHAIAFYRHSGVRSLIGVPVIAGEHLVGVLVASTRSHRAIARRDVEPLEALAGLAGAALVNVERYQTERRVARAQTQAALTDGLTGLPNRRHADETLSRLTSGTSLVMIDLDHFGAVNERLGHAGGDAVLRSIAANLAAGLRDEDFLARFGGEEFLLVFPYCDLNAAVNVVERLADAWRVTDPETTFSAGIAHYDSGDVQDTLSRADAALYHAKRDGRDRCVAEASVPVPVATI